jgi:hypothetical protein
LVSSTRITATIGPFVPGSACTSYCLGWLKSSRG